MLFGVVFPRRKLTVSSLFNSYNFLKLPLYLHTSHSYFLTTLDLPTLCSRRSYHLALLFYCIKQRTAPRHLLNVSFVKCTQTYNLQRTQTFDMPVPRTKLCLVSPLFKSSAIFDSLASAVWHEDSLLLFKFHTATHLLSTNCSCSTYPYRH